MRSMTPGERKDVKILNGSRRARIAKGSGTSVTEVNGLVKRFEAAKQMMSSMGQGGMPNLGAMQGRPGRAAGRAKQKEQARQAQAQKARVQKKARSGNPAKRRQQELEAMLPKGQRGGKAASPQGSAFGLAAAPEATDVRETMDSLPDDLKRMLGKGF